jgi:hypothetical protein
MLPVHLWAIVRWTVRWIGRELFQIGATEVQVAEVSVGDRKKGPFLPTRGITIAQERNGKNRVAGRPRCLINVRVSPLTPERKDADRCERREDGEPE